MSQKTGRHKQLSLVIGMLLFFMVLGFSGTAVLLLSDFDPQNATTSQREWQHLFQANPAASELVGFTWTAASVNESPSQTATAFPTPSLTPPPS